MTDQKGTWEELTGGGVLAMRGEFGLDASKAREKMGKFQLQDPHGYALEFVQAAVLLGAERIDVKADSDEFEITWCGEALKEEDFRDLYVSAFSRQEDRRLQSLKHLAIGVNAANALRLSRLLIEGIDREARAFRWTRIGEVEAFEWLERVAGDSRPAGTVRIYLKERFRASHLTEFVGSLSRDVAEVALIRDRCRYATQEIAINGEPIARAQAVPAECVATMPLADEAMVRGVVGLFPMSERLEMRVMQHGVLVGELYTFTSAIGGYALVDADHLQKDLSRAAIVEDEAWTRLITEVVPDAMSGLAASHLGELLGVDMQRDRVERAVQEWWIQKLLGESLITRCEDLARGITAWSEGRNRLHDVAMRFPFLLVAHEHPRFSSGLYSFLEVTTELMRTSQTVISYATEMYNEVSHPQVCFFERADTVVFMSQPWRYALDERGMVGVFARLTGLDVKDHTAVLNTRRLYKKNRAIWQSRPTITDFKDPLMSTVSVHHEEGDVTYTWSWSEHDPRTQIDYVKEGRLFASRALDAAPLFHGIKLAIQGPFISNGTFSDVMVEERHLKMMQVAFQRFPELMTLRLERLIEKGELDDALALTEGYLVELCTGDLVNSLTTCFHSNFSVYFSDNRVVMPQGHVHWEVCARIASLAIPGQRLDVLSKLGIWCDVLLYPTRHTWTQKTEMMSMNGLRALHADQQRLAYVPTSFDTSQLTHLAPPRTLLLLDEQTLPRLSEIVTRFVLHDSERELRAEIARQRFMTRETEPELSTRLHEARRHTTLFISDGVTALCALWPIGSFEDAMREAGHTIDASRVQIARSASISVSGQEFKGGMSGGSMDIKFLYESRLIKRIRNNQGVGRVEVHVDATAMTVREDFSDLYMDAINEKIVQRAEASAWEIVSQHVTDLLDRHKSLEEHELCELWGYVARIYHGESNAAISIQQLRQQCAKKPLFRLVTSQYVTHDELIRIEDDRGRYYYIYEGESVHMPLLPDGRGEVIVLPSRQFLTWLERLLDEDAECVHVAKTEEALARVARARAEFLARPILSWEQSPGNRTCVWSCPLRIGERRGTMAMWFDQDPLNSVSGVQIELLHQGRRIQTATRMMYVGRFGVRIEADDLAVDPSWDRLSRTMSFDVLCTEIVQRVTLGLERELERIQQHPESVSTNERLMWLGYLQVMEASKPRNLEEATLAQQLYDLPLFLRADGVWCALMEVRELASNSSSKIYHTRDATLHVPNSHITTTFVMPEGEHHLWRDLFARALLIKVEPVLAALAVSADFASSSRDWQTPANMERSRPAPPVRPDVAQGIAPAPAQAAPEQPVLVPDRAPPSAEEVFLSGVVAELRRRLLAGHDAPHDLICIQDGLVNRFEFNKVSAPARIAVRGDSVHVDPEHVALVALRQAPGDEVWWLVLTSSIYSAINAFYQPVSDEHEELFLVSLLVSPPSLVLQPL